MRWFPLIHSTNLWWQIQSQNYPPHHDLPQNCRGSKSIYQIFIRPKENFQSHPSKRFRINGHWSSKCKIHKLTIKIGSLGWLTWRVFYIKQKNRLTSTRSYTKPYPLPRLSLSLQGGKFMCPIFICTTKYLHSYQSKSIRINELWSNQQEQTGKKKSMLKSKLKLQRKLLQKICRTKINYKK